MNSCENPRLFFALDLDSKNQALEWIEKSRGFISAYKIGPRLFLKHGGELTSAIKAQGARLFLDFKFYDIPSSTLEAVRSAFDIGSDFVTVHASVEVETLKLLKDFEESANKERKFQILFVSLLSSLSAKEDHQEKILELADRVYQAGLRSLVCSPWELKILKQKYSDLFLVTPGIRLEGDRHDDQKRVMTPVQALREGSSALVMGRSIIRAEEPLKVLETLNQQIREFYGSS